MNIESLSDVPLYAGRPVRQVPPKRKAAGWMIVGLVNVIVFNLFIFSQTWQELTRNGSPNEFTLNVSGLTPTPLPNREQIIMPEAPGGRPPEVMVPQPLVIPPPEVQVQPQEQAPGGVTEGDLLGAVGREVACSAGNFENLTMAQRGRCGRNPWMGARMPDGNIVLMARPRSNPLFEEEDPRAQMRVTGADANLNRIQGADTGCPVILNTPCFNRIPGRN